MTTTRVQRGAVLPLLMLSAGTMLGQVATPDAGLTYQGLIPVPTWTTTGSAFPGSWTRRILSIVDPSSCPGPPRGPIRVRGSKASRGGGVRLVIHNKTKRRKAPSTRRAV